MTRSDLINCVPWSAAVAAGLGLIVFARLSADYAADGLEAFYFLGALSVAVLCANGTPETLADSAERWLTAVIMIAIVGLLYAGLCVVVVQLPLGLALEAAGIEIGRWGDISPAVFSLLTCPATLILPLWRYLSLPSDAGTPSMRGES